MNTHRFARAALMLLLPLPLCAQVYGDDNLFIPPTLIVADVFTGTAPRLLVEEQRTPYRDPLLPMIFFDRPGDTEIAARYHRFNSSGETFGYVDTADIHKPVKEGGGRRYDKYYELLDILGYRMALHDDATIVLRGGYSAEPGETPAVATARARTIREYLTSIWRIAPDRITIDSAKRLSSTTDNIIRHEEARCVTIETGSWELIRPVEYALVRYIYKPLQLKLRVVPRTVGDPIDSILVMMRSDDREIARTAIAVPPDQDSYEIVALWGWKEIEPSARSLPISIEAYVRTTNGVYRRSNGETIPWMLSVVEKPRSSALILPFFAHGDTAINDHHRHLLAEAAAERIRSGRTVSDMFEYVDVGGEDWEDRPVDDPATLALYECEQEGYGRVKGFVGSGRHLVRETPLPSGELSLYIPTAEQFIPLVSPLFWNFGGHAPFISCESMEEYRNGEGTLEAARMEALFEHATTLDPPQLLAPGEWQISLRDFSFRECLCLQDVDYPHLPEQRWYRRAITITLRD